MRFKSGAHEDKTYEEVVLKFPDFVQYMVTADVNPQVAAELRRLIRVFDDRDIVVPCHHCKKRTATRASVYVNNFDGMWFCDVCDPYSTGARSGTLRFIKTYMEALRHIDGTAGSSRSFKRKLIRWFAEGKGLPARVGERQALDFLED